MRESHLGEVEKTLLYISEARERAGRARSALEKADAEPHLIAALNATEQALTDDHKKLMQRTFFAVPSGDQERVAEANAERASRRGYLVFATDPTISPDQSGYREVFATEAKTPNQAIAKVRPLAEGRRFRAYLATGTYRDELADARWVA